ncbi:MAG: protease modulator HflC [Clostridia bacterium]|nr:protease modulator HflC [Clostridia bacterium]
MKKWIKWVSAALLVAIIFVFGFSFTVREGSYAIVSRFGNVRKTCTQAGLYLKLPSPFEKVVTFDARSQYMDSGYTETLTNDKKNIILQTYVIWHVSDPLQFYRSVGDISNASVYLNDLTSNVKNGVMGSYELSALVSTDLDSIRIDEITREMKQRIAEKALSDYGIAVEEVRIKRIALPDDNLQSVLEQMIADREKQVTKLLAEGKRDAAQITGEADAKAAQIVADGRTQAAKINAETEKKIAEIYGEAYDANAELFVYLKKLIALENSVSADTVIIMNAGDSAFDILATE